MADTTFVAGTPVVSAWLNDVNDAAYNGTAAFIEDAGSAVSRTTQAKLREYLPTPQDFGAVGDGVTDDTVALQRLHSNYSSVYYPIGTYLVSDIIPIPTNAQIYGELQQNTTIKGTHSGVIFKADYVPSNVYIDNLSFAGASCTGIAVVTTGGAFVPYFPHLNVTRCSFGYEMSYGINADLIFANIHDCSFGYFGTGVDSGTLVGINSPGDGGGNYSNQNRVTNCVFSSGTATGTAAIQISAGTGWVFEFCDFEGHGRKVIMSNVQNLIFRNCWFEASTTNSGVIIFGDYHGPAYFEGCSIFLDSAQSSCFVNWASGWGYNKLSFDKCTIAATGTAQLCSDSTTLISGPIGGDRVKITDCYISGIPTSGNLTSESDYGGILKVKGWAKITTTSPGAIVASSDPNATVTYTGVGDCTINFNHRLGTSTTLMTPTATGQNTYCIVSPSTTNAVRVLCFNRATGVAANDTVQVVVFGN